MPVQPVVKKLNPTQPDSRAEGTLKKERPRGPIKTLLVWQAPERLFKRRSREFFTTVGAIVALLVVILLFLQEWLLIAVVVALGFVSYVLGTIEPKLIEHKITNRGIVTEGRTYLWEELGRFWFNRNLGQDMVQIEAPLGFPRRLTLLLGETSRDQIKTILTKYLPLEEPEKLWLDRASDWLSRRVPLERE